MPAVDERHREAHEDHDADQRTERAREDDRAAVRLGVREALPLETAALLVLRGEALHRRHAAERVGEPCVEIADPRSDLRVAGFEPLLEPERAEDHRGDRQHRPPRDRRRDHEERRRHRDAGHRELDQVVRAAVEEAFELVDVVGEDRHQPARGTILEPAELQPLDVRERIHSSVVLHVLRDAAPCDAEEPLEEALARPHQERRDAEQHELRSRIGEAPAGDQRILPRDDDVDRGADDERRREVEQLVDHRAGDRPRDAASEGPGVAKQSDDRAVGQARQSDRSEVSDKSPGGSRASRPSLHRPSQGVEMRREPESAGTLRAATSRRAFERREASFTRSERPSTEASIRTAPGAPLLPDFGARIEGRGTRSGRAAKRSPRETRLGSGDAMHERLVPIMHHRRLRTRGVLPDRTGRGAWPRRTRGAQVRVAGVSAHRLRLTRRGCAPRGRASRCNGGDARRSRPSGSRRASPPRSPRPRSPS